MSGNKARYKLRKVIPPPLQAETEMPLVSAAAPPAFPTVNVSIVFQLSDQNSLTVSLNNSNPTEVRTSTIVKLTNVQRDDIISINGVTLGTTTISISEGTTPATPQNFNAGPVHVNYVVN